MHFIKNISGPPHTIACPCSITKSSEILRHIVPKCLFDIDVHRGGARKFPTGTALLTRNSNTVLRALLMPKISEKIILYLPKGALSLHWRRPSNNNQDGQQNYSPNTVHILSLASWTIFTQNFLCKKLPYDESADSFAAFMTPFLYWFKTSCLMFKTLK